ncbi:hypothetical protein FUAX_42720 (plasmid) [Fulvitalea axinellae]|uniref:Uncharacterized protein n=1 Tax=Fulvitalea axinellae TaxID=1182444 RepID=A0AAU9CR27_9BACT|nr:hypothetical protein FUAX_42720 [Fulvitalea axinellae]
MFASQKSRHTKPTKSLAGTLATGKAPVVQAAFRAGVLRGNTFGHRHTGKSMKMIGDKGFKAGTRLVIDDSDSVSMGTDEEAVRWVRCYDARSEEGFYIKSSMLELSETHSFRSMMGYLQQTYRERPWGNYKKTLRKKWGKDELSQGLYQECVHCAPKTYGKEEKAIPNHYENLLEIAKARPKGAKLHASMLGVKTVDCSGDYLHTKGAEKALKERFWDFYGNTTPAKALVKEEEALVKKEAAKPKHPVKGKGKGNIPDDFEGVELEEGEMKAPDKAPTARVETKKTPYEFKFYLNVMPEFVPLVVKHFVSLIDVPPTEARPRTRMVRAYGPNVTNRADSVIITVGTLESLGVMKRAITGLTREHPEYFDDKVFPFLEKLGRGCGWCEETYFENVWEMSPELMASVRRFIARAGDMIAKEDKRWFKNKANANRWDSLREGHKKALKELGAVEVSSFGMDKKNLLRMNRMVEELGGVCMSELPLKWIQYYEKMTPKSGETPSVFLIHRLEAVEKAMDRVTSSCTFPQLMCEVMEEFSKANVDFFNPHLNIPFSPFEDEDVVNVELIDTPAAKPALPIEEQADQDFTDLFTSESGRGKEKLRYRSGTWLGQVVDQAMGGRYDDLVKLREEGSLTVNTNLAKGQTTSTLLADIEKSITRTDDFLQAEHDPFRGGLSSAPDIKADPVGTEAEIMADYIIRLILSRLPEEAEADDDTFI